MGKNISLDMVEVVTNHSEFLHKNLNMCYLTLQHKIINISTSNTVYVSDGMTESIIPKSLANLLRIFPENEIDFHNTH